MIARKLLYCCIFNSMNEEWSQVIRFPLACPVRVDFTFCPRIFDYD
jgi:hypothetical protein